MIKIGDEVEIIRGNLLNVCGRVYKIKETLSDRNQRIRKIYAHWRYPNNFNGFMQEVNLKVVGEEQKKRFKSYEDFKKWNKS